MKRWKGSRWKGCKTFQEIVYSDVQEHACVEPYLNMETKVNTGV